MRRIRLTYVITDLQVGGVPLHLYRLATHLEREQFNIDVVSLADEGPVGAMLQEAGIRVHACNARSAFDVLALGRLLLHLRRLRPDVVHSLLFHANVAVRAVGPLAGIPVNRIICEIQTVERERLWHLPVDNLTCRWCRCEIGNSPSVVEYLHRHAHIPRSRLHCMLGAIDVDAIASADPIDRAAIDVPADVPLIMWTGRMDPVKGFEEMISGLSAIRESYLWHCVLVGDGPYRAKVESLIDRYRIRERVTVLGRRDDVPSLLRAADVFLFCSRTEGLPNSLLEAMAAGLPIIATNVPGCRDLITDDHTGLLIPSRSPEAVASSLRELLVDKTRRLKLGSHAQSWILQFGNLPHAVERWERFYENLDPSLHLTA
jgi:starch synthase (maltosyl-transferring)